MPKKPPTDDPTQRALLLRSLLDLYAKQADRTWLPVLVFNGLLGWLALDHAPMSLLAPWAGLQTVAMLGMPLSFRLWPAHRHDDERRMTIVLLTRGLRGLADASTALLFPYLPDHGKLLQTMIYGVLCLGAVGSSAGHAPAFNSYVLPVMGGLMLGWAFTPFQAGPAHFGLWMVLILGLSLVALTGLAKDHFRIFRASVLAQAELLTLNQQLRTTLDQAEAANAAKTRFLASASHDLRQPLHSLSLFFATLRLQLKSPDNLTLLGHIDQALGALQSQMNTLLDMSKLDAGMIKLTWQSFAIAPILEQLRSAYEPVAREKGVALHVLADSDLTVNSDAEQLSRVLRNLMDNAVKYTAQGRVLVRAFMHEGQVCVRIEDSGCGIAPELHRQVFEEFFQVDNPERDRTRGLGLGLSIVRRLATLLYVELDLQSTPGRGTTVTLTIPKGKPCQAPPPAIDPRDLQASMPMCHVLVLDDELAVRIGMQSLLQRMGCEVMLASCIQDAMAHVQHQHPDLVLADLRLRGQENGIDAVKQLRQLVPGLPAIIITGDTAPDRLRQAEAAGLPVLHKPVAPDTLMTAIATSLDTAS
ncbi:MAG: response regulator [Aquabacterium sp.]|nr:response regulator [Aquabacterium sp.]